jgi:hypothetical protein
MMENAAIRVKKNSKHKEMAVISSGSHKRLNGFSK